MVEKKPTAEEWPVITGDYIVGDPESPVAVATLASHIEEIPSTAGAAIAGPCKTENLGIENGNFFMGRSVKRSFCMFSISPNISGKYSRLEHPPRLSVSREVKLRGGKLVSFLQP